MEKHKNKIYQKVYGCQMNEYDSELVQSILTKAGYCFIDSEDEADIVLLNTCSVRENAHRKVFGRVHTICHNRGKSPVIIGILGCMASHLKEDLLNDPNVKVDFVVGPDSYKRLPQIIDQAISKGKKSFDVDLTEMETYDGIYPTREDGINAWIAIMRGCNNFCSFCVVPYARGRERSRTPQSIVDEVNRLVKDGFKQVTLLGQNVNSYSSEGKDFSDLLLMVAQSNIERIRFTSPHPKDFADKLIETIAANDKVCKQIHLPLQAGNDRILELMNRKYSQKDFLTLVKKIRSKCLNIAITTDIILGFPTETAEEFNDTIKIMEEVEFDSAFIFKYSPRKGTHAERNYPDDVTEDEKKRRIVEANELQKIISLKRNQALVGQKLDILIESFSTSKSTNDCQGRTDGNKLVIVPRGDYGVGDMINVEITSASPHVLKGQAA